jgi:YegS/Rv2252/BmrU family lipid kinase
MTGNDPRKRALTERIRTERNAVLVVNCRSRRGARLFPEAERLLRAAGFELATSYGITDPARIGPVVDEIMADRPPLLVLGSGDGTVPGVAGRLAGTDTVLGYLPMGTTNNLARSLGLPRRLDKAVEVVTSGQVVDVDLGKANGEWFANMASLGISVEVSDRTPHGLKRRIGRAAYALTGGVALRTSKPFTATVDVDGAEYTIQTHQLNIANGSVHAGTRIAADASVDDGLLNVFALGGPASWSAARAVVGQALTPNRTLARKGAISGRRVRIVTDPPQQVELDGETCGETPIELSVVRNALLIMVPPDFVDS